MEYSSIYSLDEIKKYNKQAGYHFFSSSNMRFFNSRISDIVIINNGLRCFTTSEKGPNMERRYTARCLLPNGRTTGLSEFQAFDSHKQARRHILSLTRGVCEYYLRNCEHDEQS